MRSARQQTTRTKTEEGCDGGTGGEAGTGQTSAKDTATKGTDSGAGGAEESGSSSGGGWSDALSSRRFWILALLAALGFGILAWQSFGAEISGAWGWLAVMDIEGLRAAIGDLGAWAPLVAIGLLIAHHFTPLPMEIFAVANGLVFGAWEGTLITWVGLTMSAWAGYATTRLAGAAMTGILPGDRLQRVQNWAGRRTAAELVVVRAIPLVSFHMLNWAMGLLRFPFWRFTWTTAVGSLPYVALVVVAGQVVTFGPWAIVTMAVALVALLVGVQVYKRRRANRLPE